MYFGIKWSFSVKMNLKGPLSRGSRFKCHFYLGWQGNRGSSQSFHATSFLRDCRSLIPKHEVFNRDRMHGNTNMTSNKMTKLWQKKIYTPWSINEPSLFTKIKLEWPLLGGSHFNIYLHSERRRNRGSNQDFHEISFFKDRSLINHDHFTILPTHAYTKKSNN